MSSWHGEGVGGRQVIDWQGVRWLLLKHQGWLKGMSEMFLAHELYYSERSLFASLDLVILENSLIH